MENTNEGEWQGVSRKVCSYCGKVYGCVCTPKDSHGVCEKECFDKYQLEMRSKIKRASNTNG